MLHKFTFLTGLVHQHMVLWGGWEVTHKPAANIPNSLQNMDVKNVPLSGRCGDVHLHKDIKDKKKPGTLKEQAENSIPC